VWNIPDPVSVSRFDENEFTRLWTVALATYGVGDTVTTVALLWFVGSLEEANALVRFAVDSFGLPGLVALKIAAFLVAIAVSVVGVRADDRALYVFPPAALAVLGGFLTAFNLRLLLG